MYVHIYMYIDMYTYINIYTYAHICVSTSWVGAEFVVSYVEYLRIAQ